MATFCPTCEGVSPAALSDGTQYPQLCRTHSGRIDELPGELLGEEFVFHATERDRLEALEIYEKNWSPWVQWSEARVSRHRDKKPFTLPQRKRVHD